MTKNIIDLRFAVIPYPPSKKLNEDINGAIALSNKYHPQPLSLIERLAKKFKVPANMILLTFGAEEAIQLLGRTYSQNIIYFYPTYIEYCNKHAFKAKNVMGVNSLRNSSYSIPIRKYKRSSLIFIANPNNPFGYTVKKDLSKLIVLNSDSYLVIDEAYGGFEPNLTMVSDIKKFKNLIILKSFSKDYGLAGIRIGFIIAHPEIIEKVKKISLSSNVSYPSVVIALNALKNEDYSKKIIRRVVSDRKILENTILNLGWKIFESKTNIITIKFRNVFESRKIVNYLLESGIRVGLGNGVTNIGLDDTFVRIAIGTSVQNKTLVKVIKTYNNKK